MLVLLLPIAAVLVVGCAYLVVSMAPPRARVGRWLALWIAVWTEVVLTAEILSLLDSVTPVGFLVCYAAFASVASAVWVLRGRPRTRLLTLPRPGQVGSAFRAHPALGVLVVVLAVCALVNLALAAALPVNNWDSMTYHLSRVGYWIQHGSTDHFFTHNERQNYSPPNAEFGLLSTIIFARAEWPAPFGQYAAYFVCLAAVYLIARQTGASNAASLFAALLLGTMTEMILQATNPKNDLIVASFLACSVAFALVGLRTLPAPEVRDTRMTQKRKKKRPVPRQAEVAQTDTRLRALVWSALALGLAVGTKVTAALFLPGLVVAGVVVAVTGGGKNWVRRGAFWGACCACAVLALGSFNHIRNVRNPAYRSISGPPKTARLMGLEQRTPGAVISNLARYGYFFCDFSGLLPQNLARSLTKSRAAATPPIFKKLGITVNAPELNFLGQAETFPVDEATGRFEATPSLHEDTAWFGPIAFFVGLPLVLVHLVWSPLRRHWARFAVALAPVLYWLAVCAALRYQPWGGRFFITAAVTGAPLLALTYRPTRLRAAQVLVTWLLVVVGVSTALTATFLNRSKPIVAEAGRSVFRMPRLSLRCGPCAEAYTLLSAQPKHFPEQMKLGLVMGGDDWVWPLFGPRLRRTLVPLPRDSARVAQAFRDGEVDMVAIRKTIGLKAMPPILGERPVIGPIETDIDVLRANFWSFLFHDDEYDDLVFPARDWQTPGGFVVGPDQEFVPQRVLPAGRIVIPLEPDPALVREGPLVFEFFAGETSIGTFTLTSPGPQALIVPWSPRQDPEKQTLRIRVTCAATLPKGTYVYRLLHWDWPRFEQVP